MGSRTWHSCCYALRPEQQLRQPGDNNKNGTSNARQHRNQKVMRAQTKEQCSADAYLNRQYTPATEFFDELHVVLHAYGRDAYAKYINGSRAKCVNGHVTPVFGNTHLVNPPGYPPPPCSEYFSTSATQSGAARTIVVEDGFGRIGCM